MANLVKDLGKGIVYLGMGTMFVMAIVGSISIDLVLVAALAKALRSNSSSNNNSFLTGYLWGTLFSSRNSSTGGFYSNLGVMLLASPILTLAAIGLSFALGVPEVGIALAVGWGVAFGLVALGAFIHGVGKMLESLTSVIGSLFSRTSSYHYNPNYAFPQPSNTTIRKGDLLSRAFLSQAPVITYGAQHVVTRCEEPPVTAVRVGPHQQSIFSRAYQNDMANKGFLPPTAIVAPSAPTEEAVNGKFLPNVN